MILDYQHIGWKELKYSGGKLTLNGGAIRSCFYVDTVKGLVRTYDVLGDGKTYPSSRLMPSDIPGLHLPPDGAAYLEMTGQIKVFTKECNRLVFWIMQIRDWWLYEIQLRWDAIWVRNFNRQLAKMKIAQSTSNSPGGSTIPPAASGIKSHFPQPARKPAWRFRRFPKTSGPCPGFSFTGTPRSEPVKTTRTSGRSVPGSASASRILRG